MGLARYQISPSFLDFLKFRYRKEILTKPDILLVWVVFLMMDFFFKGVISYQFDLAKGNLHNLVAILVHHKNISLQGAVNLAGNAFVTFCSLELASKEGWLQKGTIVLHVFPWVWTSLVPSCNNKLSSETVSNKTLTAVQDYITRLKDCIVGTVNWLYEPELYFGKKESEISKFRWVFINAIAADEHGD